MADYEKSGAETRVNVTAEGSQGAPYVATLADGRYAIAWGTQGSGMGAGTGVVLARIYNADGTPASGEIAIAASEDFSMAVNSITGLAGGGFAIGYYETSTQNVRVRIVGADGTPGADIVPNPSQAATQYNPEVTALEGGDFLVTWLQPDTASQFGDLGVSARLYHADGSPASDTFQVNVQRDMYQSGGKAVALAGGGFAIAWSDYNSAIDGSQASSRLRLFAADGTPVTGEIAVNATTAGSQLVEDVVALGDGGFLVHYQNNQRGGAGQVNSFVQAFDASGGKVGEEIALAGLAGRIEQLPDGSFVHIYTGGALPAEVHLQRYDASFAAIGSVEYANTALAGTQAGADVTILNDGFVVTYFTGDTTVDGSGGAILMQRFAADLPSGPATSGDDVLTAPSDMPWRVNGRGGDDVLAGRGGDDRIQGGGGDDVLRGGGGGDRLTGGAGADRFAFGSGDLANAPGAFDARILDFDAGAGDRIDLSALDGALAFIGDARFSGAAGEVRAVLRGDVTFVYADVDGDRTADLVVKLEGAPWLNAADFIL